MKTKKIYILANGHKQASDFARSEGLWPMHWVYLSKPDQVKGLSRPNYIVLGDNKYTNGIINELESRGGVRCADVSVSTK